MRNIRKNRGVEKHIFALMCSAALYVSVVYIFVCRFTRAGVLFGDVTTSDPDIYNWGRASLNVIHLDSCACAGTAPIKSACYKVSSWHSHYLRTVGLHFLPPTSQETEPHK